MPTTGRLADKFALVIGAASGIGQATALLFAKEGAVVAVADLDTTGVEATAGMIQKQSGKASAHRLDVTSEDAWAQLQGQLPQGPRLDVMVNSAGISFSKPISDMSLAEWERVLAVNLTGVFLGTRFALRLMQERGEGSIINVASTAGVKAIPGASAYSVSKAGVCMLSRVAALEAVQHGSKIRVNSVLPGGVKTPLWRQMDFFAKLVNKTGSEEAAFDALAQAVPLKRYASSEEIAHTILYLASEESSYITGTELVIDGGWTV